MPADFPVVKTEISFASGPLVASPTWVDVSADVRRCEINRGREHEMSLFDTGNCSLRLNNTHRKYDPANTSSIYAPNVIPMRQIRVTADYEGVNGIPLFRGYIDSLAPKILGSANAEIMIEAVDALAVLARLGLGGATYGLQQSGSRFASVMATIGWPAGLMDHRVIAEQFWHTDAEEVEETALEHLQKVTQSEMGQLFADGAGKVVFRDRRWYIDLMTAAYVATWGDDPAELPYTDLNASTDGDRVFNHVVVSLPEWDPAEREDATSIATYLRRTLPVDTDLFYPHEADGLADALRWRYRNPRQRFQSSSLKPVYNAVVGTSLWLKILQAEIGQHHLINHRPPGGGPLTTVPSFIERLQHVIGPGRSWTSEFGLASPDPVTSFWKIGDATLGKLDSGGGLAY